MPPRKEARRQQTLGRTLSPLPGGTPGCCNHPPPRSLQRAAGEQGGPSAGRGCCAEGSVLPLTLDWDRPPPQPVPRRSVLWGLPQAYLDKRPAEVSSCKVGALPLPCGGGLGWGEHASPQGLPRAGSTWAHAVCQGRDNSVASSRPLTSPPLGPQDPHPSLRDGLGRRMGPSALLAAFLLQQLPRVRQLPLLPAAPAVAGQPPGRGGGSARVCCVSLSSLAL